MYIEETTVYYDGTEQRCRRANFLILMQPDDDFWNEDGTVNKNRSTGNNLRAVVRKVALHQFGHWMMGRANIGGKWITISGSYGQDGLPKTVAKDIWERGVPLPDELYEAWNKGEGWNSCGTEAPSMREWAQTINK